MKKCVFAIIVIALAGIFCGCSLFRGAEKTSKAIAQVEFEPHEFYKIPVPVEGIVSTVDFYDDNKVIMTMCTGEKDSEYRVLTYDTVTHRFNTLYLGDRVINYKFAIGSTFQCVSIKPYVVIDISQEYLYKFSDDFTSVELLDISDLNTAGSYRIVYSASRNSIIYTRNDRAICEIREFTLDDSKDNLLLDLKERLGSVFIEKLLDDSDTLVLSCNKLFSDSFAYMLLDLNTLKFTGEFQNWQVAGQSDNGFYATMYDDDDYTKSYIAGVNTDDGKIDCAYSISSFNAMTYFDSDVMIAVDQPTYTDMNFSIFDLSAGKWLVNSGFNCEEFLGVDIEVPEYYGENTDYSYDDEMMEDGAYDDGENEEYTDDVYDDEVYESQDPNYDENTCLFAECSECNPYDNGKLVFFINHNSHCVVVLWDTTLAKQLNEPLDKAEIEYPIKEVVEKTTYSNKSELAESIEKTYGVNIYYGDDADIEFIDYDVEMIYDEETIRLGLLALDAALELYPEGFFKDFTENNYLRGINFYLCGDMKPNNDQSIDDPAAFTYNDSDFAMVVMNIEYYDSLVTNFCHEMSHVIDNRLIVERYLDEDTWNSYNPEGFKYNYSYMDESGGEYHQNANDEYTQFDMDYYETGDAEYIYFVDSYSKTYPTEDRARLMENSMTADDYTPMFFDSSHVSEKLEYYAKCIRECWDSANWPETVQWEKVLVS